MNSRISLYDFKEIIHNKGGIWASDDVYFTQFMDGYGATYKPNFPNHTKDDCAISYNWIKDMWNYIPPEMYDKMYSA